LDGPIVCCTIGPDGGVVTHSVLATLYNGDVTGTPKIPLVFAVVVARVSMQFLLIVLFVFRPIKSIGSIGRHFDIVAPQSYLSFTGFLALVFLLVFESDLDIAVVVGNVEGMHSVDGYKSVYGIVDCGGHIAIASTEPKTLLGAGLSSRVLTSDIKCCERYS
jgi:hypothetical protein